MLFFETRCNVFNNFLALPVVFIFVCDSILHINKTPVKPLLLMPLVMDG